MFDILDTHTHTHQCAHRGNFKWNAASLCWIQKRTALINVCLCECVCPRCHKQQHGEQNGSICSLQELWGRAASVSLWVGESLTVLLQAGIDVCVYLSVWYNRLMIPWPTSYSVRVKKTKKKHKPVTDLHYWFCFCLFLCFWFYVSWIRCAVSFW